jgi:hypothetical protein
LKSDEESDFEFEKDEEEQEEVTKVSSIFIESQTCFRSQILSLLQDIFLLKNSLTNISIYWRA